MIQDGQNHAILQASFGDYAVFPCTLDTASRILAAQTSNIPSSIVQLSKDIEASREEKDKDGTVRDGKIKEGTPKTFRFIERARDAIEELYNASAGDPCPKLHRFLTGERPGVDEAVLKATQEDQEALAIWLHRHRIEPKVFHSQNCLELSGLSFMAPFFDRHAGQEIVFVREDDFDEAHELFVLHGNRWKEDASELRVVGRILSFANRYTHRDEKFHLAQRKEIFS